MKVKTLTQTHYASPTQFEGITDENKCICIRFRFGRLTISITDNIDLICKTIYNESIGHDFDGHIGFEKIKELTINLNIEWPQKVDYE